jgi:signal transduction histidine kinase
MGAGLALVLVAGGTVPFPSPAQRVAAHVALPLVVPLIAAAISRLDASVVLAVLGGLVAGLGSALVLDPFRDPACVTDCYQNPLAVTHDGVLSSRLALVGAATAAVALGLVALRQRGPRHQSVALAVGAVSLLLLPAGAQWAVIVGAAACLAVRARDTERVVTARRRVDELVEMLRSAPQDIGALLRRRMGDESIDIFFPAGPDGAFVDVDGRPADRLPVGMSDTDVRSTDRLLARVRHDPSAVDVTSLADALDAPARLALENGRLEAAVAVRRRELTETRRRIVERADSERRSLERDVHDGAQQHVLALGMELRVARRDIEGTETSEPGDSSRVAVLDQCLDLTGVALDDLRELSHGLYPAILDLSGLLAALRSLARRSRVPLELDQVVDVRLPTEVERAAFAVVADAVAKGRESVRVSVTSDDSVAVVRIVGAPDQPGDVLADRVAVAGGHFGQWPSTWEAVFPCASS